MQLSEREPSIPTTGKFVESNRANFKISVATNSNVSWSKTFDLDNTVLGTKGNYLKIYYWQRFWKKKDNIKFFSSKEYK